MIHVGNFNWILSILRGLFQVLIILISIAKTQGWRYGLRVSAVILACFIAGCFRAISQHKSLSRFDLNLFHLLFFLAFLRDSNINFWLSQLRSYELLWKLLRWLSQSRFNDISNPLLLLVQTDPSFLRTIHLLNPCTNKSFWFDFGGHILEFQITQLQMDLLLLKWNTVPLLDFEFELVKSVLSVRIGVK